MTDRPIARLELELARGVEPITGRVQADDTPARPFTGVLELITLLDEARTEDDPETRPPLTAKSPAWAGDPIPQTAQEA